MNKKEIERNNKWIEHFWSIQIWKCDIPFNFNIEIGDIIRISPPPTMFAEEYVIMKVEHSVDITHIEFKAAKIDIEKINYWDGKEMVKL